MRKISTSILMILFVLGCLLGVTEGATSAANQEDFVGGNHAAVDPFVPGGYTFYAVYDRLTDTDTDGLNVTSVALSGDGNKLIYAGRVLEQNIAVLYTMNVDGSNKKTIQLPPEVAALSVREVAIDYDGSVAFFNHNNGEAVYKVEGNTVTKIIDAGDYPDIDWCDDIKTTADGDFVFFRTGFGQDIWRVSGNGGLPEKIVEDTEVPRGHGVTGYQITSYDISADGSVVAFIQPAVKPYKVLPQVFVKQAGVFTQLTHDVTNVTKGYLALSGDGNTIVFKNATEQKWYAINVISGELREIADANDFAAQPDLNYDGAVMFEYVKNLVYTDGSGGLDLFPYGDVTSIPIAATYERNISNNGHRVAFIYQWQIKPTKNALYVGYLAEPDAVPSAPNIHWSSFNPPAMPRGVPDANIIITSLVSDPQGLDDIIKTRMDTYIDGRFTHPIDCPVFVKTHTRDDGVSPDGVAGDGVYTTWGEPGKTIDTLDKMTVRMAVMDSSKTIVVADRTLFIFNPHHEVGGEGGAITSDDGNIEIDVPSGAVTNATVFTLIPLTTPTMSTGNLSYGGTSFQLSAKDQATDAPVNTFNPPLMITIHYDSAALNGIDENDLKLYYWDVDETKWQDAACGPYDRSVPNQFTVDVCHLSEFAVVEGVESGYQTFLPILIH